MHQTNQREIVYVRRALARARPLHTYIPTRYIVLYYAGADAMPIYSLPYYVSTVQLVMHAPLFAIQ